MRPTTTPPHYPPHLIAQRRSPKTGSPKTGSLRTGSPRDENARVVVVCCRPCVGGRAFQKIEILIFIRVNTIDQLDTK
jgi:hypothetical protein